MPSALYCDQCDQPATQEIDWVELTDTLDERGNTTTICDSHTCWEAAIQTIEDEFGGKVQQTRYSGHASDGLHRRNHEVPARTITTGDFVGNTSEIVSAVSERVACYDCGRYYNPNPGGNRELALRCVANARQAAGLPPLAAVS